MKKNYLLIMGMAVVLLSFVVSLTACTAQSGGGKASGRSVTLTEQDFKYDMTRDGSGVKLLTYIGDKGGNLIIPDTIEGFPVVALGDIDAEQNEYAGYFSGFGEKLETIRQNQLASEYEQTRERGKFVASESILGTKNRTDRITSITIPDTVTFIGPGTFGNCEGLKSITFPRDLKLIGANAFEESGLTTVTIPDGVSVGQYAFTKCKNLTTITLGENVSLKPSAFSDNLELTTVNLPSVITYLVESGNRWVRQTRSSEFWGAFNNCPKLSLAARAAITASGYVDEF